MRTRLYSFDQMEFFLGRADSQEASTNRRELQSTASLLHTAIQQELTPRQRECLLLYYESQQTMEEIGQALHIGKSTVCRHLQKAQRRLRRVLAYTPLGQKGD